MVENTTVNPIQSDKGSLQNATPQTPPTHVPQQSTEPLSSQVHQVTGTSTHNSVDVNIDGIPAKVYLTSPTAKIVAVMNGDKEVWKGRENESCVYCVSFLKDNHPAIMAVAVKTYYGILTHFYKYKFDKWYPSTVKYGQKIDALKTHQDAPSKLSIDLFSSTEDTNTFKVLREEKGGGLITRYYTPVAGYYIEEVKDGQTTVWTSTDASICYLAELHSKGSSSLLRLHIKSGNHRFTFQTFEKDAGGGWKGMTEDDYADKRREMEEKHAL